MLTTGPGSGVVIGSGVGSDVGASDGDSAGAPAAVGKEIRVGVATITAEVPSGVVVGEEPGVIWGAEVLHARARAINDKVTKSWTGL